MIKNKKYKKTLSPFTENPGYDAFDDIGIVFNITVIVITTTVINYNKEKKIQTAKRRKL